ncbi:hypothetical protein E2C01_065917 [Portunus trituberculatus]|uniref:Uncharacterized protein n=1 Tax=Portunus trituberculatus TaxID=210409 RepID=A0A5B7HNF2_PORTR|nr:hypothetical protein [Portunus trituberculatus]
MKKEEERKKRKIRKEERKDLAQHRSFKSTSISKQAFHGNLWTKGDTFWGTSYLKAHRLGNRCPE